MKLKPKDPAAVVRDPITRQPLAADGTEVPDTSYWVRRLRAGEVELVREPEHATAAAPNPSAEPAVINLPNVGPIPPLTTRS